MKSLKGIGVSSGLAMGKIILIEEENTEIKKIKIENIDLELKKFNNSLNKAKKEVEDLKQNIEKNIGKENSEIFDAHLEILSDPEVIKKIEEMIKNDAVNASFATHTIENEFIKIFQELEDEYFKERAVDIKDSLTRVIKILENKKHYDLSSFNENIIIVAKDLTPSQTSQLNPKFVKGFITEIGGKTSHSAIIARTLGIPAVSGIKDITKKITKNEKVALIDGTTGLIIFNPDKKEIEDYKNKEILLKKIADEEESFRTKRTLTIDNFEPKLALNISSIDNLLQNNDLNTDGIGLFRTEFIYMNSKNWPTEEEQFKIYKKVLETTKNKVVVIRTLDIGGDKKLNYFDFPEEANPFLGYRAIRLQLDKKDIFKTQIRALLRASKFGNLAINLPMIATMEEWKESYKLFKETEKELENEKIEIGKYQLGIMIEVPSAALLAEQFAKYVDFFSIGTNDLIQYTFAADRMSEKVSYLYQPFNPAILKLIKMVIDASHKEGKWTAICGELAREPKLVPVFAAMKLDEFSMSSSILKIRRILSKINTNDFKPILEEILNSESEAEVEKLVDNYFEKINLTF